MDNISDSFNAVSKFRNRRRRVVIDDSDEDSKNGVVPESDDESDQSSPNAVPESPIIIDAELSDKEMESFIEDLAMKSASLLLTDDDEDDKDDVHIISADTSKNESILSVVEESFEEDKENKSSDKSDATEHSVHSEHTTSVEDSQDGNDSDESENSEVEIIHISVPSTNAKQEYRETKPTDRGDSEKKHGASPAADRAEEIKLRISRLEEGLKLSDRLPDKGVRLRVQLQELRRELDQLGKSATQNKRPVILSGGDDVARVNANSDHGGAKPKLVPHPVVNPWEEKRREQYWNEKYAVVADSHRLYGGKMTDARYNEARFLTQDAISRLHKAVSTCPPSTKETDDPPGLLVKLMEHQRQALTWLVWRENQNPSGGILADDMGLGKTLTMIALILLQKYNNVDSSEDTERYRKLATENQKLIPSSANLIICPTSVMSQWEKEIERRVKPGKLSVLVYHGAQRETSAHRLARYDVVLSTYGTVSSELTERTGGDDNERSRKKGINVPSPLLRVAWERIILDEAHQIRNHTTNQAQACCKLPTAIRWALTGTPLQNHLKDLYSLMKFLRYAPFDELAVWNEWIERKTEQSKHRLDSIINAILFRRTKNDVSATTGKALVHLPPKRYDVETLTFSDLERKIYDQMFKSSQIYVKELLKDQAQKNAELIKISTGQATHAELGYRNPFKTGPKRLDEAQEGSSNLAILVILLRLRQACVHFTLMKEGIDLDSLMTIGSEDDAAVRLTDKLNELSLLEDEDQESGSDDASSIANMFEKSALSTKMRAILQRLDHFRDISRRDNGSRPKFVLVSQWVQVLQILASQLKSRGISWTMLAGDVKPDERGRRIDQFNNLNGGPEVMLLSLTAGGVGVNLVGGNHLFVIDLHWNPALEKQACDRIYRVGQTRDVFIHKFVVQDTIEQRVMSLQEEKLKLADGVLSGTDTKKLGKLTLHDLKFLFGLS